MPHLAPGVMSFSGSNGIVVVTERKSVETCHKSAISGAGGGLISNFEQLVRGVWKPETNELLQMS